MSAFIEIVQVGTVRKVAVPYSAEKQIVKDVKLQENTGDIMIALWKEASIIPCSVGQQLCATRLRVTEYNSKARLQST